MVLQYSLDCQFQSEIMPSITSVLPLKMMSHGKWVSHLCFFTFFFCDLKRVEIDSASRSSHVTTSIAILLKICSYSVDIGDKERYRKDRLKWWQLQPGCDSCFLDVCWKRWLNFQEDSKYKGGYTFNLEKQLCQQCVANYI